MPRLLAKVDFLFPDALETAVHARILPGAYRGDVVLRQRDDRYAHFSECVVMPGEAEVEVVEAV